MKSLLGVILIITSGSVLAWDDQQDDPYKRNGEPNYRYQGRMGTEYQYDLNKPQDQLRYELDTKARLMDELNVDPRRDIDRNLGQYGGGIRR